MRSERPGRSGPWFWAHPLTALSVACVLAAAVNLALFTVGPRHHSVVDLYSLPIALVALTAGRRAGLVAGLCVAMMLGLWSVLSLDAQLDLTDWLCHVLPMLMLGVLVGDAAERIRSAARTERRAAALEHLGRDSAEAHDALMQHLAAAKWRLEAGDVDAGIEALTEAMTDGQQMVARMIGSGSALDRGDRLVSWPSGSTQLHVHDAAGD